MNAYRHRTHPGRRLLTALYQGTLSIWTGWLMLIALTGAAQAEDFPALHKLALKGARVSALVVNLPDGKLLAQMTPDTRLTPASTTKLYTAAASLMAWGPYHTFSTQLLAAAPPQKGKIRGNLVLLGGGDPTLTYSGLWQLTAQLSEQGTRQVNGDLVIDESLFGAVPCLGDDRCDAATGSRFAYDAPLSSAGINFGTWCVAISPVETGKPARVRQCQLSIPDLALDGKVNTVAAGGKTDVRVSRTLAGDHDRLILAGTIAADSPVQHIYRSVSNAPLQTGQILREVLMRSGIHIKGKLRVASTPVTEGMQTLASVDSISLAEQLMRMMTYSNNYMADTLALNLLTRQPEINKPLTLEAAGAQLQALAANLTPQQSPTTPLIYSGSGLTPNNAISATDLVALFQSMYQRTDLFPAFVGSLSVPTFSPLSIFRGGESGWKKRIAAKTGSLLDPVTALSVAGYFRTKEGNWGAFALMLNGSEQWPHVPFADGMQALRQDLERILEQY